MKLAMINQIPKTANTNGTALTMVIPASWKYPAIIADAKTIRNTPIFSGAQGTRFNGNLMKISVVYSLIVTLLQVLICGRLLKRSSVHILFNLT